MNVESLINLNNEHCFFHLKGQSKYLDTMSNFSQLQLLITKIKIDTTDKVFRNIYRFNVTYGIDSPGLEISIEIGSLGPGLRNMPM